MAYTKKIEIQLLSDDETDDIGQPLNGWQTVFTPWAEVDCVGGKEYYAAAQSNSENDMIFKIRYSKLIADKLTSELRIIYNGIIYDVKHIDDRKQLHREFVIRAQQLNGGVRS